MSKNKHQPPFPLHPDEATRWFKITPPESAIALIFKPAGTKFEPKGEVRVFGGGKQIGVGTGAMVVEGTLFRWLVAGVELEAVAIEGTQYMEMIQRPVHLVVDCMHDGLEPPREYLRRMCSEEFAAKTMRKLYTRGSDPAVDIERLGAALRAIR